MFNNSLLVRIAPSKGAGFRFETCWGRQNRPKKLAYLQGVLQKRTETSVLCSKGPIQRHTELGETTVKRMIREFLKEGTRLFLCDHPEKV